MTAGRSDRRVVQLRRRGRHNSPSQVEKVALQAGKAAPAVAIAGALVAAPASAHALADARPAAAVAAEHQTAETTAARTQAAPTTKATLDSFETKTVTVAAAKSARHSTAAQATYYRVRSGDSLSKIAEQRYGSTSDWRYLYSVNAKTIPNPDDIFAGELILLPATVPGNYTPKHSKPAAVTETASKETAKHSTVVIERSAAGTYSCAGLEQIWEEAGGSASTAHMAAEIAKAESGGNPNAISPTDDYGLWQINRSNGSLATLNPLGNAHSAVEMSHDGSNWNAWTTYHSGAYYGKC
jgi:LysM repeat protein